MGTSLALIRTLGSVPSVSGGSTTIIYRHHEVEEGMEKVGWVGGWVDWVGGWMDG